MLAKDTRESEMAVEEQKDIGCLKNFESTTKEMETKQNFSSSIIERLRFPPSLPVYSAETQN